MRFYSAWLLSCYTWLLSISYSVCMVYDDYAFLDSNFSLIRPFNSVFWEPFGSTHIDSSLIRLTYDQPGNIGHIWNTQPNYLVSWEMHMEFRVSGRAANHHCGDGFAIWYAKDPFVSGTAFGSKSLFHGVGLFFDTYNNFPEKHYHMHPYVSAMVSNGSQSYDHGTNGIAGELGGCSALFRNSPHRTFAALRYYKQTLTVGLDVYGQGRWEKCIFADNVNLPTGYFFGISASTGDLSDNHDLLALRIYNLDVLNFPSGQMHKQPLLPSAEQRAEAERTEAASGQHVALTIMMAGAGLCTVIGVLGACLFLWGADYLHFDLNLKGHKRL